MSSVTRTYYWLQDGNEITGQMLANIIAEIKPRSLEMKGLYERFKGTKDGVPIHKREFPIDNISKINNKLANDFFSDIINTKVGYFAGKPITYKYGGKTDIDKEVLGGFLKRTSYADLDSETAKMAAICGYAVRYLYIDLDGAADVINVPPWECTFICDEIGVADAEYALRYYSTERDNKNYFKVEFFDQDTISYWIREGGIDSKEPFELDPQEEANPIAHLMDGCPLICFPNNEEMQGDCEKVLSLIDGYDKSLSDMNSEIEQFRLAYMAFIGMVPSDETLNKARQTGAFGFPEKDSRMEFVTKNLNSAAVENHLKMLEENIIYFAQSVRFSDEAFGQASGVAMKFKIFALESKCMICERKFIKSLYKMFEVLNGYFGRKSLNYDPGEFEFTFVRNFPLNLNDEVAALATMKGLVSDETAYSQMSFIPDPIAEIEKVKKEQDAYMQAQQELQNAAMQQQGQVDEFGNPITQEQPPSQPATSNTIGVST